MSKVFLIDKRYNKNLCLIIALGLLVCLMAFYVNSVFAQIQDEENLYTIAIGAFKNGFLDIAVEQFQEFLKLYPDSPKAPFAWFRIGEVYRTQKKAAIAEVAYQKVIELTPQGEIGELALYRLSGLKFGKRDFKGAISGYQRLIQDAPSSDYAKEALFWLAEALYQSGRYTEAFDAYHDFNLKSPRHKLTAQAQLGEGWCLMELGKYREAVILFSKMLKRGVPSDIEPQIWLKLGDAYFELKSYKDAVNQYARFLKLRPSDVHYVVLRQGYALSQVKRFDEAIRLFQNFLSNYSKADQNITQESLFRLGETYYRLNRYKDVIAPVLRLKKEYPGYSLLPGALFLLANSYIKTGMETEAVETLKEIIAKYPKREEANNASLLMGNLMYAKNNPQEAISYYSIAVAAKDQTIAAEAQYRLGESLLQRGDTDKAIGIYRSIEETSSGQTVWVQMGYFRLGNIYEQKGNLKYALQAYEKAANIKGGLKELAEAAQKRIEKVINSK